MIQICRKRVEDYLISIWKEILTSINISDRQQDLQMNNRGVYFSTIRVQSVWKTNNEIVEGKYSICWKFMWFLSTFIWLNETKLIILIPSIKY